MGLKGNFGEEILDTMGDLIGRRLESDPVLKKNLYDSLQGALDQDGIAFTGENLRTFLSGFLFKFTMDKKIRDDFGYNESKAFDFTAMTVAVIKNVSNKLKAKEVAGVDTTKLNVSSL